MAQYGSTGSKGNSDRTGSRQSQSGSYGSYQSGYRGENRTDEDYGTSYGLGSGFGSASGYGSGQYSKLQDYGSDDSRNRSGSMGTGRNTESGIAIEETHRLIGSDKVEGTAVYDRSGERIGTIHNFMVDKRSGKVEYAVMSFGGFMGMGKTFYPLPWQMLDYDTDLGGFRVEIDEEDLDHAPSFRAGGEPEFNDQYGRQVYGYYGMPW